MHVPVLLDAAIAGLSIRANGTYVDCTAGGGGHSEAIARGLSGTGRLVAIDRDPDAVARVRERLGALENVLVVHGDYGELSGLLGRHGIKGVDGVLIDAGVSSDQLDTPERGFSFQREGPLDMRMDTTAGITAAELLNTASEEDLARLLRTYGDLRPARSTARAIVSQRNRKPFQTTMDLVEAVRAAFPYVSGVPEEVRKVFQAVRIAVNRELESLEAGLHDAVACLNPGGRLACITFHSGEDRIVKNFLREASRPGTLLHPDGRVKERRPAILRILTHKPVVANRAEVEANPRAHSAKLRVGERMVAS